MSLLSSNAHIQLDPFPSSLSQGLETWTQLRNSHQSHTRWPKPLMPSSYLAHGRSEAGSLLRTSTKSPGLLTCPLWVGAWLVESP